MQTILIKKNLSSLIFKHTKLRVSWNKCMSGKNQII